MILKGRRKINSGYKTSDMLEFENVRHVINNAMNTHRANKAEIDYLLDYHKGVQPILEKIKLVRPEINNILLVNHAQRITRTIVGYFLGNPIQYIQNNLESKDDIDNLNKILSYEHKSMVDTSVGEFQSIVGTAYKIIVSDDTDDVPFETRSLNPSNTFVVYENDIVEAPLMGVTYRSQYNKDGEFDGYKFFAYTKVGVYEIISNSEGEITNESDFMFFEYNVGGVPIVEYPNNQWLLGDWELALSVMEAINKLHSGRFDDLEQIIQSLLVFTNAEIDADLYERMREAGVVMLKNTTNNKTSVQMLSNSLDQAGMNLYATELLNVLDTIVGIPSRDSRSGGGADTGQAVELRDGWADLEIVARNKESIYKKSERQTLKIILNILNVKNNSNLDLMDVDIKFVRNKNHNLLVKSQSYVNIISTKTVSPADALSMVDIVSDTNEYASRGEAYWEEKEKEAIENDETNVTEKNIVNNE